MTALPTTHEESAARTAPAEPAVAPPVVRARDLVLHGGRGAVYGPVDLEVHRGELAIMHGPQGGGRSSLLLTLAGRMVPDRGSDLTVLGHSLPAERRAVQRRAALAGFTGIDDLDDSVTVGALLRERLTWLSPWHRRVPVVPQHDVERHLGPVFGPRPLPRVDSVVWDLDEVDVMLLRLGLAMLQRPALLVVDDVDQVHDSARRQFVWSRLEALTAAGTTVIASTASLDEVSRLRWQREPRQIFLATGPHARQAV